MTFPLSYSEECAIQAQKLIENYGFVDINRFLLQPTVDNELQEELTRRTEMYAPVQDDSSTESMPQVASAVGLQNRPNQLLPRLHLTSSSLQLLSQNFKPIFIDFTSNAIQKRAKNPKNQGLIKAVKPKNGLKILDATAGFGRDAFILASMGADVLMLERSPILAALLRDGLERLHLYQNLNFSFRRGLLSLDLVFTDSINYFLNLEPENYPDVIYLDPMHPLRKKNALVKKDMQLLQEIIGFDVGVKDLLSIAISKCKQSVVVKWPQKEKPLFEPHHSIVGKTVRFDVYFKFGSCNSREKV